MTQTTETWAEPDDPDAQRVWEHFKAVLGELGRLPEQVRARLQGQFAQLLVDRTVTLDTPRGPLSFVTLGKLGARRGMTMLKKQPATIEWIDRFRPGSVFWDAGANVGIYTLYAALRGDTSVVAFEPAAVNYFLLSANCQINGFDDRVQCLAAGLGRDKGISSLEVSQFAPARSFSFRARAEELYTGRQSAPVFSVDQLVDDYGLACPNYLKIDVPGMTEDILEGAARTLSRPEFRELHVELRPQTKSEQQMIRRMARHGLVLEGRDIHGGGVGVDATFVRGVGGP
jgi:FkbM family methyltransferase